MLYIVKTRKPHEMMLTTTSHNQWWNGDRCLLHTGLSLNMWFIRLLAKKTRARGMKNMMPRPGKEPVMDTRSDTSQVAKAIAMEGTRATRVLMGRLNLFTHSHAPSSLSGTKRTRLFRRVMQIRGKLVVSVNTGYKASKTATTSFVLPSKKVV